MDYTKEESLIFARKMLEEGNQDYLYHYANLREKDPGNEEAEFFSGYFLYKISVEDKKEFIYTEDSILRMVKGAAAAVKSIKASGGPVEEQIVVLKEMMKLAQHTREQREFQPIQRPNSRVYQACPRDTKETSVVKMEGMR